MLQCIHAGMTEPTYGFVPFELASPLPVIIREELDRTTAHILGVGWFAYGDNEELAMDRAADMLNIGLSYFEERPVTPSYTQHMYRLMAGVAENEGQLVGTRKVTIADGPRYLPRQFTLQFYTLPDPEEAYWPEWYKEHMQRVREQLDPIIERARERSSLDTFF
jgi:hypothetical protein